MLLVVSLDSESLSWLDAQIDAGLLPNLQALIRSASRFPVQVPYLEGTAYPTIYTGQGAGDHGIYYPYQWRAEEQRVRLWGLQPFPETIFEKADRAGRRILVLDPPEASPFPLKNGIGITGIQFRARGLLRNWCSSPKEAANLRTVIGDSPVASEVFGQPHVPSLMHLSYVLRRAPARLGAAVKHFLKDGFPDCLWINFCAMHVAAHQFFDLGLLKSNENRAGLESTRLDVARGYDAMLGSLLDSLPAGSPVLAFFEKGMSITYGWNDLLPAMLRTVLGSRGGDQPVLRLRWLVPQPVRARFSSFLPDRAALQLTAHLASPRAQWSSTRAFALPSEGHGWIRFNVRGREPAGVVTDSEVEELTQQIREGLAAFTDVDGEPCVHRVITREEAIGSGKQEDRFPDLFVEWSPKSTLLGRAIQSPRSGVLHRRGVGTGRSGTHSSGAMAVISPGRYRLYAPGRMVRAEDIPATVSSVLGLATPECNGLPLLEVPQASTVRVLQP